MPSSGKSFWTVSPIMNSAKALAALGWGEPLMMAVGAATANAPSAGITVRILCPAFRSTHAY